MNRRRALGVAGMWRKGSSTEARILIVDDEESNVRLLERALTQAGYGNITSTTHPREVSCLVAECEPDLILLDLMMPQMDGFEVMQVLGALSTRDSYLPILVLTADTTTETRRRALAAEFRDDDTGQHTRRVGRTAFLIARTMGVTSGVLEPIERAAALHDVGK